MCIQHRSYAVPEPQVGSTHNASGNPHRAVLAGGAHCSNAADELDLADGAHGFWPVGFEHRGAFDEHGRHDIVTTPHIREDLVEQIAWGDACGPEIPQMMVRVANWQVRLKRSLDRQREPVSIGGW